MLKPKNNTIEKCEFADYDSLINLWEKSVRATHHFLTEPEILFYKKKIAEEYFDFVTLYKLIVAGDIIGFIGIKGKKLEMLFLHPAHFRKGYGKLLLDYAINSTGTTSVDVNQENKTACEFYKSMGFKPFAVSEKDGEGKEHPIIHLVLGKNKIEG